MNMKHRLTIRFILQLALAGVVTLLLGLISFFWIMTKLSDIDSSRIFPSPELGVKIIESSTVTKEGIQYDAELLKQVKQNNGWLQSLDEDGKVVQSFNTPSDVPKSYLPGQFVSYFTKKNSFPYHVYFWVKERDGQIFSIVYGVRDELGTLLTKVATEGSVSSKEGLKLPAGVAEQVKALGGYIQLLDSNGMELASFNKPDSVVNNYTLQDLSLRVVYQEQYGFRIDSSYNEETGLTWLVALPYSNGSNDGKGTQMKEETKVLLIGIGSTFLALMVIFILLSLWNAHRFGGPMLHMLAWLDSLGKSNYEEPRDRKGITRSRTRKGRWRSRYRVFSDVMDSIQTLSATLLRDDELRKQNNNYREEWISGITHDLKTPLSSIKGYAHMLSEDNYEWSPKEVRKFSRIMLEKSAHMDSLINDLAMTYRLSAGVEAPKGDRIELNDWLRSSLEQVAMNPSFDRSRILFVPANKDVMVQLYTPWLERVVMNIVANALLHNPPQTLLTVSLLEPMDQKGMTITFSDNGKGMDELSASRLFDRYYRGTDTSSMLEGSGLGMAISRGLVEAMGGEITVDTALGKGTTIRLIWSSFPSEKEKE
ncbi:HAMP domain-containing sensor histidine kinase [Paenibacillus sp. L3-i20]|uniref:ATP-binding response regulator n=1 Tax=Paenibacillus sp. L3-i20 TaxID=2905833 RepID=UPI001EE14038|nr:HAMP domain-containing sensor histidine kinase [Paenibacillus sp. L3-i20]GKU76183.1 two-component sensor histidine kinase [Paenibacillus sp. L3-i20]